MRKAITKRLSISMQDENRCLLDRFMRYKSKDADKLNEENENFLRKRLPSIFRKRSDKLKRDLEDAVREPGSPRRDSGSPSYLGDDGDSISLTGGGNNGAAGGVDYFNLDDMLGPLHELPPYNPCIISSTTPTKIYVNFEAHENESHAVRWSPVERMVATGGADRKVKLWDVGKVVQDPRAVLGGSSAGINSVDFDSTGTYIMGTSNDYGARVWTVADSRLRVSGKGKKAQNGNTNDNDECADQNENNLEDIKANKAYAARDNCATDSLMINADNQYFSSV